MKTTRSSTFALTSIFVLLATFPTATIAADAARVTGILKVEGLTFSNDSNNTVITKPSEFPFPWTILGSDIYYLTGNVGINTMTPSSKLDVNGTVRATSFQGDGTGLSNVTASSVNAANVSGTVAVINGGTGAVTASTALTNLGAVAKAGDTMSGTLNLPANGLQMSGSQIVTSGGRLGYGAAPNVLGLFNIGGTYTAPTTTAHLLHIDGTAKASGVAYLRGINVEPTFDLSVGYANFLVGIEANMSKPLLGSNIAHSVIGFNINTQPTSSPECNVAFGIGVPTQQLGSCNGRYGFYQGGPNTQYNYFASNVGIGTPTPTQALTVQGNAQVSGNVSAAGTGTMPVYNSSGSAIAAPHMVTGTVVVSGTGSVTLSGSAAFSSAGSYVCTVTPAIPATAIGVQYTSGNTFVLNGAVTGPVNYICVGN
jgi:hypothetical protein